MTEYSKYPICDTDIWVNLCLGEIEKNLFNKYLKVSFVDVVKDEILNWTKSKNSFIAEKFNIASNNSKAITINVCEGETSDIDKLDRLIIEKQLIEDAGFPKGFKTPRGKERKNMGEYLSAIVADYLEIPLMKSNDHLFRDGERGKELYPNLIVKNWEDTLKDLVPEKEIKGIRKKVNIANNEMRKEKKAYENGRATLESIQKLADKFNCKF